MLLALACTRPPVARPDRLWGSDRPRQLAGAAVDVLPGDEAPILVSAPNDPDPYDDDADRRGTGVVFRLSPHAPAGMLQDAASTRYLSPGGEVTVFGEEAFFSPDLDGDAAPDVVVSGPQRHYSDGVGALIYDAATRGSVHPDGARALLSTFDPPRPVALGPVGDADGDGHADLVVSDLVGDGVALWRGPFLPGPPNAASDADWVADLPFRESGALAAADLDGDADSELLIAGYEPYGLSVIDPAEPLDVDGVPPIRTRSSSALHVSGDLDDDGLPDVVFGGVFTRLPDDPEPWWRLDEPFGAVATGDFDGDGRDDLVVEVGSLRNRTRAYLFRGPLPHGVATSADADLVIEAHDGPDGWPGLTFAAGDVDGDGRDDLVVGEPGDEESFAGGSVSLYLGRSLFP
jgi:hypothetical protein